MSVDVLEVWVNVQGEAEQGGSTRSDAVVIGRREGCRVTFDVERDGVGYGGLEVGLGVQMDMLEGWLNVREGTERGKVFFSASLLRGLETARYGCRGRRRWARGFVSRCWGWWLDVL